VEWTDEEAFAITCSSDRVCAMDGCCLLPGWTEDMEASVNKYAGLTAAACSRQTTFLLAMVAENGTLLVLANLQPAVVLDSVRMEEPVRSVAWSPVETLLGAAAGQSILLFRATQAPRVHAVAFSGDGALLASRDAHGLKIWDVESATLTAALHEDIKTDPISGIAFHPTLPLLAAVTPDGSAFRILEVEQ
jgi:hypothetical protein